MTSRPRVPLGCRGNALVAQGIEHRSPKAGVVGSNPTGGTISEQAKKKAPDQRRRCQGPPHVSGCTWVFPSDVDRSSRIRPEIWGAATGRRDRVRELPRRATVSARSHRPGTWRRRRPAPLPSSLPTRRRRSVALDVTCCVLRTRCLRMALQPTYEKRSHMLPKREPSFDLAELSGCQVDVAQQRCEQDGFTVQVVDIDAHPSVTLDLRPNRIRPTVRKTRVVEARQG